MDLDDLRRVLAAHEPEPVPALPGRTNHLHAGVLVPLVWGPRPQVVATLRAASLRQHAGEVAFPGGKPDPEDLDLQATALREATEELGITEVDVLGRLASIPLYTSDYRLVPTVAVVPDRFRPNPDEVAAVLRYDLLDLLDLPSFPSIPWEHDGVRHLSPVFPHGDHVMYGGTAYVLHELLGLVAEAAGRPLPPCVPGGFTWEQLLR